MIVPENFWFELFLSFLGSASIDGQIYQIAGCLNEDFSTNEVWSPETKSFKNISPCISKRDSQGQAVIDGEIFVVGGYDNISTKYEISKIFWQILDTFLQIFEIGGKVFTDLGFLD